MKEIRNKPFCLGLSLAENTRNEPARFSCLDMRTRPLFGVFPLFKLFITVSPKTFKQIYADLFERIRTKKDHLANVPSFIEIHGTKRRGNDLKIASFSDFFLLKMSLFKFNAQFLKSIMGKI